MSMGCLPDTALNLHSVNYVYDTLKNKDIIIPVCNTESGLRLSNFLLSHTAGTGRVWKGLGEQLKRLRDVCECWGLFKLP